MRVAPVRRRQRPVPAWLVAAGGVPAATGALCYVKTHDFAGSFQDFMQGRVAEWPPPRVPGAVSPLTPVVEALPLVGAGVLVALGLAAVWRIRGPVSFERVVGRRLRNRRRWLRYRLRWRSAMLEAHMENRVGDKMTLPALRSVTSHGWSDDLHVRVRMVKDDRPWKLAAPGLANFYKARDCRVRERPGWVDLKMIWTNPLEAMVPMLEPREDVDLTAVPVGVTEDGDEWTLPLFDDKACHLLIASTSGGGKSGLMWSLIAGVAGRVHAGDVQLWGIDGKGGAELRTGPELFTYWSDHSDPKVTLALLQRLNKLMADRALKTEGTHVASVDEPYILLIIDEILNLKTFGMDPKVGAQIEREIGRLLSQGRALGVTVVGITQDARQQAMGALRTHFNQGVILRMTEETQPDMGLRTGAFAKGARATDIGTDMQGTGYVWRDCDPAPVMVRSCLVTKGDRAGLARDYAPPAQAEVSVAAGSHEYALPAEKPVKAPVRLTGPVPRTKDQQDAHDDMLARWEREGYGPDRVREAEFTILDTPFSANDPKQRNKFSIDRAKQALQQRMAEKLLGLGLDMPIAKEGELVATLTFRFSTRHKRELPNFEGPAKKALGDALRVYRIDPPKWMLDAGYSPGDPRWIANDSDDELRFIPAAISGGRGEPATTVRLTWRVPT